MIGHEKKKNMGSYTLYRTSDNSSELPQLLLILFCILAMTPNLWALVVRLEEGHPVNFCKKG